MDGYALLIDYKYCTGCHVCEVSCRKEHDIPLDEWGIKINEMGPVKMQGKWLWDYIPVPSDLCDLCAERVAEGKDPRCGVPPSPCGAPLYIPLICIVFRFLACIFQDDRLSNASSEQDGCNA